MTPEERNVIEVALAWRHAREERRMPLTSELLIAVQALKISRQPEHTVAPLPCGAVSSSGRMRCELPAGHDPDDSLEWTLFAANGWHYAYRVHQSRAANGQRRAWTEWTEKRR